jgi:tRNA G18 (ribose-2'-O)-methylase SpoU
MQKIDKIDSITHPWIQHLRKLVSDPKYRKIQKSTVIVNKNVLDELSNPKDIINFASTEQFGGNRKQNFLLADSRFINYVSGSASNDNFLAEIKCPEIKNSLDPSYAEKSVILPCIKDPSNLGLIARCAKALFAERIIIGQPGSVDPFNYKTINTSRGTILDASFVTTADGESLMSKLKRPTILAEIENKIPPSYVKVFEKGFLNFYGKIGSKFPKLNNYKLQRMNIILGCESNGFDEFHNHKLEYPENYLLVAINSRDQTSMNVATSLATIASACWPPETGSLNLIKPWHQAR